MLNSTSITYQMKREILSFPRKSIPWNALGLIRDGSKSTNAKNVYEKGYHVTEACVLTNNVHPVSVFSQIHSSKEKDFTSINDITFSAMERGATLFGKAMMPIFPM